MDKLYIVIIILLCASSIRIDIKNPSVKSFVNKTKWAQLIVFICILILYLARAEIYDMLLYKNLIIFDTNIYYFLFTEDLTKNQRFLINNFTRTIQHIVLIYIVLKVTYKDHRAIIPWLLSTVIALLYILSNFYIFTYESREIQKIIYAVRIPLGILSLLSFVDYGDKFYGKLFRNINVSRTTLFGSLLPYYENTENSHSVIKKRKGLQ